MKYTVYKATNTLNRKCYIGFDSRWPRRKHKHRFEGKNGKTHFHRAIRKYGFENFEWEILYQSNDLDFTKNIMEGYFIRLFDSFSNGYNKTLGGEGGMGRKKSPEEIAKIKANQPKTLTEEHKNKLRLAKLGKKRGPQKEETKIKIGNANRGKNNGMYGKSPWNKRNDNESDLRAVT